MGEPASQASAARSPSVQVLAQFLRDMSFERPLSSTASVPLDQQPTINIVMNANARPVQDNDFEVELTLNAKAAKADMVIYEVEIEYAGLFRLENIPPQLIQPMTLIECPRMLFPFVRQILAEVTRQGGFPPLLLDPIDFAAMYQKRLQQEVAGGPQAAA
jgi:preprotein translocase subunit SecB